MTNLPRLRTKLHPTTVTNSKCLIRVCWAEPAHQLPQTSSRRPWRFHRPIRWRIWVIIDLLKTKKSEDHCIFIWKNKWFKILNRSDFNIIFILIYVNIKFLSKTAFNHFFAHVHVKHLSKGFHIEEPLRILFLELVCKHHLHKLIPCYHRITLPKKQIYELFFVHFIKLIQIKLLCLVHLFQCPSILELFILGLATTLQKRSRIITNRLNSYFLRS